LQISPDEFKLPFFKEEGFARKQCPSCGNFFWALDPQQETCGDAPCVDYTFINNPPTIRSYNISQMREKFLSFFEEHGHKRVKPYPIVARWRDDLMVTIASIIDFQPYVTEGIIPPPANPLVVSQPCLRFEDFDLVGVTAGRHLTIFEMGGHHAFNYRDQPQIYWKDETIRYHHKLITHELGVPDELVTYKEGIWSGGGNAGFCVEPCVGGLEISTLVFMMYRVIGAHLEPMPIQVVDTGYGIERWTWLTQGSPSAFHACYDSILDQAFHWAGLEPDIKILSELAKYSYLIDLENRDEEQMIIANRVGIDYQDMKQFINPIEGIYAALDHTKALAFILSEGVVPSNSREGYLARMLYRRGYRMLRRAQIEDRMPELIKAQIDFWGKDFRQLEEMREDIIEMVKVEEEKYLETLNRGAGMVRRSLKDSRKISLEDLIELYDSHGLTPEDVKEVASQVGVDVEVPSDFYTLVAQRHLEEKPKDGFEEEELAPKVERISETRRLFLEDQYLREFDAIILDIIDDKYLALDQTVFFAESGGQLSDKGFLYLKDESMKVKGAKSIEGVILHEVEENKALVGDKIHGVIDWDRREALMRAHTATHIILGAARRVLGEHAWQAGAAKGIEHSRLDVSHYSRITIEQIEEIENLANKLVREGRPVVCRWMQRDEAEERYGFRLYQGGAVPGKKIRIVDMGEWDVEACGGTHLSNTCQAGIIKVIDTERVQDGIERITYSVGPYALKEVQKRERLLMDIAELLGSPLYDVKENVSNNLEEMKELRTKLEEAKEIIAGYKAKTLIKNAHNIEGIKLVFYSDDIDIETLIGIGNILEEEEPNIVAVMQSEMENRTAVKVGDKAQDKGIHAGDLVKRLAQVIGGGGGGASYFAQGGGGDPSKFSRAKEAIIDEILEQLKG
jgi:alanyl-tRNA synthetase